MVSSQPRPAVFALFGECTQPSAAARGLAGAHIIAPAVSPWLSRTLPAPTHPMPLQMSSPRAITSAWLPGERLSSKCTAHGVSKRSDSTPCCSRTGQDTAGARVTLLPVTAVLLYWCGWPLRAHRKHAPVRPLMPALPIPVSPPFAPGSGWPLLVMDG